MDGDGIATAKRISFDCSINMVYLSFSRWIYFQMKAAVANSLALKKAIESLGKSSPEKSFLKGWE